MRNKYEILMLLVSCLSLSTLFTGCSGVMNEVIENKLNFINQSVHDQLIISALNSDNKGEIIALNLKDNTQSNIIKDRDVGITGDISGDGSKVAYADALGDSDPWQIYLHNLKNNETTKVTNDKYGKVHAKIASDNSIYFMTVTKDSVFKVGKVDDTTGSYTILDNDVAEREADTFDTKNNMVIISTESRELELKKAKENKGNYVSIPHTIFKTDLNGSKLEKVGEVQASAIDSISLSYDNTKVTIGGCDINGDTGAGIYELDIESGTVTKILTDNMLKSMDESINKLSNPILTVLSKDESMIYFTGVPKDCINVDIAGISCSPASIFSYNKDTKKIQEVLKPSKASMIVDLNIKY